MLTFAEAIGPDGTREIIHIAYDSTFHDLERQLKELDEQGYRDIRLQATALSPKGMARLAELRRNP